MSAEPELPPITCPTSLVASCAPLLGYQPRDCVVGFILGVPNRSAPVLVRLDLGSPDDAPRRAADLASSIAGTGGREVDLVAWVDVADRARRGELPSAHLLDDLVVRLAAHGVDVLTCVSTNGRVWWSHDCPDDLCCGDARELDPSVLTSVQAEYVYAGYAPLASRAELAERLMADPERSTRVSRALCRRRTPSDVERWRDLQIGFLSSLLVPGSAGGTNQRGAGAVARLRGAPLDPAQAARAVRGLADVVVRDTVLRRLIVDRSSGDAQWRLTVDLLADLVRCAPGRWAAPPATLLAIVAWMRGEGSLASLALDRAEDGDAAYRLAALTREVIARGIDPRVWRAGMSGLTEWECRQRPGRGAGAPGRR